MNCKPGDLAVVVRCQQNPSEIGRLYRCVKATFFHGYLCWITEPKPAGSWDGFADIWLRPIRDQEGEDETLTWAGKPKVREQA